MARALRNRKKSRGTDAPKSAVLRAVGSRVANEGPDEILIPTRWVKFVAGLLLLPVLWVWTQTFFLVFAVATVKQRFWATEEFYFFALGAVLWLIAFVGLRKPVVVYVFGHELTHAIWVMLMGGRVTGFDVGKYGGSIETDKNNFLISLAPYFFPIYSILLIVIYGVLGLYVDLTPYRCWMFGLLGATWCFHATFTAWMIPKGQSDLRQHGTFFSLVIINLFNLMILSALLIVASPQVGWKMFARALFRNAVEFSAWICSVPLVPK